MKIAVFVDVQNDFVSGSLGSEKAVSTVPKIVEFAKKCVAEGYVTFATMDTHKRSRCANIGMMEFVKGDNGECIKKETSLPADDGYFSTLEGKRLPVEHCIEGTYGWKIVKELADVLGDGCSVLNKFTFGSEYLADCIEHDVGAGEKIEEIVLCGFVTSICVLANAVLLRARFPNTKITVMKDLCAGVTDEDHNAAIKVLEMQQIDVV